MNSGKKIALIGGILALVAALVFVLPPIYHAVQRARAPLLTGAWQGTIHLPQASLRCVLKIARSNGVYHATLDSIDQRLADISVSKIEYDYPTVTVELSSLGANYVAKLDATGKQMVGDWKQAKMTFPLTLERTANPDKISEPMAESDYQPGAGPQGAWQGALQINGVSLRLKFRFGTNSDGTWRGEMDSVDQGVKALVASSVEFDAPTVKVKFSQIGGAFEGDLDAPRNHLDGTWTQVGKEFPLKLARGDTAPEAAASEEDYEFTSPTEMQGHWWGTLVIKTTKLRIVFHIAKAPGPSYTAALESPDQGGGRVPASSASSEGTKIHLEWKALGASYDGELQDGRLEGTFTQAGMTMPLKMERNAKS
jgi:hypothetical protein